jgi:hypothetical protein
VVLANVIWIAGAAVAFSVNLGYGMAIAILGGVALLALLGSVRGLMTAAVVLAILVYRLFREIHPEGARSLDIGQHYTMVGIALGALIPLLPIEWGRGRTALRSMQAGVGAMLWLLVLVGTPVAAAVMLGSKGAIGMVVGFSFAAVVDSLRSVVSLAPAGVAVGLGAVTALSYGWLSPWMDLERAQKQHALIYIAITVAVLAGAIYAVSRQPKAAESK